MAPDVLLPLEQLAQEQHGTYTDGRFITLNSVIEEERVEIKVGDVMVYIHHTVRKSARPSMGASFWRIRTVIPGKRKLWVRLYRKNLNRTRWPWRRVFLSHPEKGVRWENRGYTRYPSAKWVNHPALQEGLRMTDAVSILIMPHGKLGTRIEMHLKGEPANYPVLEDQWQAFMRLMECVMLV